MATAEELLRLTPKDENVDKIFHIDMDTRTIKIPPSVKQLGVESDDDVKVITFSMPRYYYDTDLIDFDIYINYLNAQKEGDLFEVAMVQEDGDNLVFDWTVGRHAVAFKGKVIFNVCMKKIPRDADGNALRDEEDNVIVEKEFNTTIAELPVLEGLETGEEIAEDYIDILMQWEEALFGLENSVKSRIEEKAEEQMDIIEERVETVILNKTDEVVVTVIEQAAIDIRKKTDDSIDTIQTATDELIDDILNNEFCGTVEITDKDPVKKSTVLTISPSEEEVNVYTAEEVDSMIDELQEDVNQKLIGKADKELIVTVTGSESVGYTADKTSAEIADAWHSGCDVRVVRASNSRVYHPYSIKDTGCIFVNISSTEDDYGYLLRHETLVIFPTGVATIETIKDPVIPTTDENDVGKVLMVDADGCWAACDDNSVKSISLNGVEQNIDDNGNVALTFEIDPSEFDVDLTGYLQEKDVVNDLTSDATNKPLSAAQGKVLKDSLNDYYNRDEIRLLMEDHQNNSDIHLPTVTTEDAGKVLTVGVDGGWGAVEIDIPEGGSGGDCNSLTAYPATSEDGVTYTATIPGIEELNNGMTIVVIPNMTPTRTTFTLSVNGLANSRVCRKGSNGNMVTASTHINVTNFVANVPVVLTRVGGYWVILDAVKPVWDDIMGNPIPAVTAEDAGKILTVGADGSWGVRAIYTPTPDLNVTDDGNGNVTIKLQTGKTITFTITGTSDGIEEYMAEEGMTWADWCYSEYDTGGYRINYNTVCGPYNDSNFTDIIADVEPSEIIENGRVYERFMGVIN